MTWRDLHIKKSSSKQDSTLGLQVGEVFFITGDFGALESHEMSGLIFQKSQCSWQTAKLPAFGRVVQPRKPWNWSQQKDAIPPTKKTSFQPLPRSYGLSMAMMGYAFFCWGNRFSQENLNGLAGKTSISFIQNWHQTSTCPVVSFAWCESYPDRSNISLTRSWRNGPRSDFFRLFRFVVDRVI